MRRRVIPLFLAVAVLCSCMTVTVGASEVEMQQLINVLEFDTVNGSGNYYLTGSKGAASASFSLPYGTLVRYIDMYISTNNQAFESINWEVNGTDFPLTVEEVYGSTYYRVYGQVSGGYTDTIKLDFKWVNSGNYKLQFYSLHVSAQTFSGHSAPSTLTLVTWEKLSATQETGTSSVMLVSTAGSTGNGITIGVSDFLIGVHNSDWQKYDRMNFTFMVSAATVNNITCTISNQLVPCEISFVEGTLPSYDSFWVEGSDGENSVFYEIDVSVDLSGVNRTLTDDLIVCVEGTAGRVAVALYDSRGYTIAELPEAEVSWLQRIWNALGDGFQSVVDAIKGDTGAADEFNDQVQDELDELEQDQAVIDSMTTPDVEDIVGNVDIDADAGEGIGFIGDVFNALWGSPLSLIFLYSGTFALIAYVLYGRRS